MNARLIRCLVVASALLALAGCESDEHKAARLSQEENVRCLGPDMTAEGKYSSTPDEIAQCAAARRAYNKFVAGR